MKRSVGFFLTLFVLLYSLGAVAQNKDARTIAGVVKNEKGQPLPGITISEKGGTRNAVTSDDGSFKIQVVPATAAVVVSGVGYETQEVKIKQQTSLVIVLKVDPKTLTDVVVIGYGSQSKAKVTGATATVKMDELLGDRPVTSLGSLLQGATPGLQISIGSGQPGAGTNWNIRGVTDYQLDANGNYVANAGAPLIVVDNVPYTGPTNLLDPNDIESVTVLKDPASASIYGSRTAFGVVVITTKSGKKNQKAQFNYSNNIVFATPTNLPVKATPMQQVQAWMDGGMTTYNGGQNLAQWMTMLQDYQANPGKYPLGGDTVGGIYYQLAPTDAVKELLGNHSTQIMNNFSVSGGNDKTTYRMSFGTTNENGILVPSANQDGFKRYNLRSLVTSDVNSWLNLQMDAAYNNSTTKSPFYTNAFGDATNTPSALALDSIPQKYPGQIIKTAKNEIMQQAPIVNQFGEIRATGRAIIKPMKGLTITGEYTIDNITNDVTNYDKRAPIQMLNPYGYTLENLGNDQYQKSHGWNNLNAINIFGNYVFTIDHKHNFTALAGFNQEQRNTGTDYTTVSGLLNPDMPFYSGTTGLIPPVASNSGYADAATRGFFGRLNYDFKNKYLVQVSYRYDGSSKFPAGHRWVGLPGASVGWRLTEENFMQSVKPYLNEFKLRADYGSVANQNIPDYGFYPGMNVANPNWLSNGTKLGTLTPPPLVSSNFTWETVSSADFGFDWGVLKNRLSGTFDWYQRDTKGIIAPAASAPAVLGTNFPTQNAGAIRTNGYEIAVNWRDHVGKVGYNIGVSLYNYSSVVVKFANAAMAIQNNQLYNGKHIGEIWGYVTDRFYDTTDFVKGSLNSSLRGGKLLPGVPHQNGQNPNPGDILFKDLNGDSLITVGANTLADHGDQKVIGNSTPQYQYGINGGVSYANFDLSFIISGVGKQDAWMNNGLVFPNQWVTYGALYSHETNYWTPTNTNAYYARIYTDNVNTGQANQAFNQVAQSRYLFNKAYLRLRNITLRYTVPSSTAILQKIHVSKFSVFATMENVATFSHMPKGMDPDISVQGGTAGGGLGYPFMRKTSVGLNVSF
jgi:TonB-linked SusC/RagA family outer membrane protein